MSVLTVKINTRITIEYQKTNTMVKTIEITIEECTDERLPASERFLAYISDDGPYKGTVASAESISEVLKEIGISIEVKDKYMATLKK